MANASNLLLIFCCFVAGMALKRLRVMPQDASIALNRFIIYVSLPALTLEQIHGVHLTGNALYPVAMPWIYFALAAIFFRVIAKPLRWEMGTIGALILTGGLGNTSFVGFPLIETFYGKEALPIGVLIDQPGSFLVLSTLGVLTASIFAGSQFSISKTIRGILVFPPFLALVIATCLHPFSYPEVFTQVLGRLGSTLVPLALVSVGMQLSFNRQSLREEAVPLSIGLVYKLVLGPALIALIYFKLMGARGREIELSVFQAAMAPMITGGILATEAGLNPQLASLMVGIGIPISLLTVAAWWWLLSH